MFKGQSNNNRYWLNAWRDDSSDPGLNYPKKRDAILDAFFALELPANSRVLVPLCGKTIDMLAIAEYGYFVTGVELSELAVKDFFESNNIPVTSHNNLEKPSQPILREMVSNS